MHKPNPLNSNPYTPCRHDFIGESSARYQFDCSDCKCGLISKFCDKYCLCDPDFCQIRRQGCKCYGNCKQQSCVCFQLGAECDPDLCLNCFEHDPYGFIQLKQNEMKKYGSCQNNEILFNLIPRTAISNSQIENSGYGLILVEPVEKGQLIGLYLGEVITDLEQEIRAILDNCDDFYAFEIIDKQKLIDAKYFGNKLRFINHSKIKNNCIVRIVYSKGDLHIGVYSLEHLGPNIELFIDYDGNKELCEKYTWINAELKISDKTIS